MLAALLLLGASVCAGEPAPPRRSVILISVDALRADCIGARRDGVELTPHLNRLAASGAYFENTVSQAPWTLPSMASVFTAMSPQQHGLTNRFTSSDEGARREARLPAKFVTLAEAFRSAGYDTAAFTGAGGLDGSFGFSRGFDVYGDSVPFIGFETTVPQALDWLSRRGTRPFFLFVHGYDVHGQYLLPELTGRFSTRYKGIYTGAVDEHLSLRQATLAGESLPVSRQDEDFWSARYDEQVARADARLGAFLSSLPDAASGTIVAVMSDHGEELFDHGGVGHGTTLYDEVLRVPLLLSGPGVPARRIVAQTRLLDLAPTLLDLAGIESAPFQEQSRGVSLRPLLEGRPLGLSAYSHTQFLFRVSKLSLRAADGLKVIFDLTDLRREGYDVARDPRESVDLALTAPARLVPLETRLRAAERLVGAGADSGAPVLGPISLELMEEGYARQRAGDFENARALLEAAVDAHPASSFYLHHLGALYGFEGDWASALGPLEQAAAMRKSLPDLAYYHTLRWQAMALRELGRDEEALAVYRLILRDTSDTPRWEAAVFGADFLLSTGRKAQAVEILRRAQRWCKAREKDPFNVACVETALLLASARLDEDAEGSMRLALDALDRLLEARGQDEADLAFGYRLALDYFASAGQHNVAALSETRLREVFSRVPRGWRRNSYQALLERRSQAPR